MFKVMFLSLFLFSSACMQAGSSRDFNANLMLATPSSIFVLSALEHKDFIVAYNEQGTVQWSTSFIPKIISWQLKDGRLYVFSKSRFEEKTYLTCLDPSTGDIFWEC